jgi:hypothetical protein
MSSPLPPFSAAHRRLHLDYHNPAGIPDLAADFDGAEFAATIAGAGFDSATLFAQDAHGHVYFPTEVGVRHPALQIDLFGEQVAACQARGITVGAYLNTGCSDYAPAECVQHNADGTSRELVGGGGYRLICLNSPYIEENVLPLSREILERYPVDALWFDLLFFHDEGCHCRWCVERMSRLGLDPKSPADVRAHMRGSVDEFAQKVAALIAAVKPGTEFTLNGLSLHERPAGLDLAAYVDIEALATGGWGYFYVPCKARYLRTLGKPVMGMTAAFHNTWGDFGTLKSRAMLEHEVYTFLAAGIEVAIGDQLPPRGRLEPARYARIAEVLGPVANLRPYLDGATPLVEAAVVLPPLAQGQFPSPPWLGACKLLMESRVQFDTVDRQADWSGYRLLVLPDEVYADDATREKVAAFLQARGAVLATGDAVDALPRDLVRRSGAHPPGPAYLRERGDWAGLPDLPHVIRGGFARIEAPGAEVLATYTAPYPARGDNFFFSSPQVAYAQDTDEPVMVRRGRLIYAAAPLFSEYVRTGYGEVRRLLQAALKLLLPEPLVLDNLPLSAEVALLRQGNRLICVIVPYAPVRGEGVPQIDEWPPVGPVCVGVPGRFTTVHILPGMTRLSCRSGEKHSYAYLPVLRGPTVLAFE